MPVVARADAPISATYGSQTIRFTHLESGSLGLAIGTQDPGLQALLHATGAVLTWKPGERYVMITTPVPVVVSFSVGDKRYDVGPISLSASFAPYQEGSEVYLPFQEVLRALDLALRQDGQSAVLQPQLASLDITAQGNRVTMVAHGGAPLHPRIVEQRNDAVTYEFDGVGTTLNGERNVNVGGVRSVQIAESGTPRDPKTQVTVLLMQGALAEVPRSNDDRDVVLSFSGSGAMPSNAAAAAPPQTAPQTAPAPNVANQNNSVSPNEASNAAGEPPAQGEPAVPAGPATVTGVTVAQTADGYTVAIATTGNANFQWHRLRDPDNRFWVDISPAQLQGPPVEQDEPDPLGSLRVRQMDAQTVRVAISLLGPKMLTLSPSAASLNVEVSRQDAPTDVARNGSGSFGNVLSSSEQQEALVTPAPYDEYGATGQSDDLANWKFGPREPQYVPNNPRLIVIDPGHGGSDRGAVRNGLSEAEVNLDMAKRLRDLLVAAGWQVRLTHDTDVDVYQADDSPHDELQARVNVANNAGARLFVSIHANSFINSGPYGTTCYISKKGDWALARVIERHLESDGTKDDGIIKSHLYVTLHTRMPAVLIETAFLSNPSDFALLSSSAWRQKIAQEISDGIGEYTRAYPVPNDPQ